jgi:putative AdoMet-dependent methyltransferase
VAFPFGKDTMESNPRKIERYPASGFDAWAESYDRSVFSERFPFNGYNEVLARIITLAEPRPGMPVLDLGTGTGNLALSFQRAGCHLWCTDFSMPMLMSARLRLPEAHLLLHNLLTPLPLDPTHRFERIVSAYVFHHFELRDKVHILLGLRGHLAHGGSIVIGDIAFPNEENRDRIREAAKGEWEEEYYWLGDESLAALKEAGLAACYQPVSACAGVFQILT